MLPLNFFFVCKICWCFFSVHIQSHTATAIPFIYSFSGNSAASAPISTFLCLWAIYIDPGAVFIFPPAEKADPSWEYIIRSQTHECGNWDWDPDIPFLGIFVSNFRHFVFAVQVYKSRYLRSTYYVSHAFGELGGVFTIIFGSLEGHYLNSE